VRSRIERVGSLAIGLRFDCYAILAWKGPAGGQPRYIHSDCAGAVLAPTYQPAVAGLAEYSVANGAAISQRDHAAACGIRSSLQSLAAQLTLSLQSSLTGGQVKQPLGTVAANDGVVANGDLGQGHSHHSGDAGGGQTVRAGHDSLGMVRGPFASLVCILGHRVAPGYGADPIVHKPK
jgi:hypothetical protein